MATLGLIWPLLVLLGAVLALLLVRRGAGRAHRLPAKAANPILIDGSNVMHWQDNSPQLAPLLLVIEKLIGEGYAPAVVFDANAGWKLKNRYLDDADFAALLLLPTAQVFVVPKGSQADPYLLDTARRFNARIVTNDRFRDWAEAYPEVLAPEFLLRGRVEAGTLRLDGLQPAPKTATTH